MRDPQVEEFLANRHVDWVFVQSAPIDQINIKLSRGNQARFEKDLKPSMLEDLRVALRHGADMKAVVAYRSKKGDYVLIGGNHRHQAHLDEERTTIDLYEVKVTDSLVIEELTLTINQLEGRRETRENMLKSAVGFVERNGISLADAARRFVIPEHALSTLVKAEETRKRVIGTPGSTQLSTTHLVQLGSIQNDVLLNNAAEAIGTGALSLEEARPLINVARKARNEADGLKELEQVKEQLGVRERIAVTQGGKQTRGQGVRTRFFSLMTQLLSVLEDAPELAQLGLTSEADQRRALGQLLKMERHTQYLAKVIERGHGVRL